MRGQMTKKKAKVEEARPKITAWSFSRWAQHSGDAGCPFKAYLKFVKRLPEPAGPAMARGAAIHELAQAALEKPKLAVPPELTTVKKVVARLRKLRAQAELELALTREWAKTGWFEKTTWLRIKVDAIAAVNKSGSAVEVVDWKTGKYRPDSKEYGLQLELYGAGVLSAYPDVAEARTRLVFTDHDQVAAPPREAAFARKDLPRLVSAWEGRVRPLLADTRFAPRPGWYCRNCHFRKSNNGPCQY